MDKLKPILAQKFWILLFLAIVLPAVGWFMASGQSAEAIETRRTAIDGSFSSVNLGPNPPNGSWVSGASVIVNEEQRRLDTAAQSLWEAQQKVKVWPRGVARLVEGIEPGGELPGKALEAYRDQVYGGYYEQLDEIEAILRPFDLSTGSGVILYDTSAVTHLIQEGAWKLLPPKSSEAWDAQEDLWLTRSIFESIAEVNKGADKIGDATVRQLLKLSFRGGVRDYSPASAGGTEGAGLEMDPMYSEGMSGNSSGQSGTMNLGKLEFDLSDELGPDQSAMTGQMSYETMPMESAESPAEGATAAKGPVRYVDNADDLPFRTRAFVLGAIIDHRQLHSYLAALSESEFPVQVIRVSVSMMNPDLLEERGGRPGSRSTRPMGNFGANMMESSPSMMEGDSGASPFGNRFGTSRRPTTSPMSPTTGPGSSNPLDVRRSEAARLLAEQAMRDPFLAEVWVGGLMTIFKPITPTEGATDAVPTTETPADPATTVTETPTDPAAPAATADPTAPVDPAAPAETPVDPAATTPTDPATPPADPATSAETPATDETTPPTPTEPAPATDETTPN